MGRSEKPPPRTVADDGQRCWGSLLLHPPHCSPSKGVYRVAHHTTIRSLVALYDWTWRERKHITKASYDVLSSFALALEASSACLPP